MKVLLIEDEKHTASRLQQLILDYSNDIEIVGLLTSVASSVEWLNQHEPPDLIFQDIELSDGICFDIYEETSVDVPVIFTTAYSEYAVKSFQVNSIDYLVKPYDGNDIKRVLDKYRKFSHLFQKSQADMIRKLVRTKEHVYRTRILVRIGDTFKIVNTADIAYILSDESLNFAYDFNARKYPLNQTLNELNEQLEPSAFFRINRNCILNAKSIKKISNWFNSRLKLELDPPLNHEIIVSRTRVKDFKIWLGE